MPKFLALYMGRPEGFEAWQALEQQEREKREAEGMKAWQNWHAQHASIISDDGGPVGKTKRTSASGVTDHKNEVCGYVLIEAASHDAAARLFENHPHFAIFPGDAVEIMECTTIPGM